MSWGYPLVSHDLIESMARARMDTYRVNTIRVDRHDDVFFSEETGLVSSTSVTAVFTGPARLSMVSGPGEFLLGDEPQFHQRGTAYMTWDVATPPMVNDVVVVLASRDPRMVDRWFRVLDVDYSGQWRASTALMLSGVQAAPNTVML